MHVLRYLLSIILVCVGEQVYSQACTALGQNPSSSFPVCGTAVFQQSRVPECGNRPVPSPCNDDVTDINPFWYRFTCFETGTLGFEIIPDDLSEDYDWQLFDITGKNPNDVYQDRTMFVACNWSGEVGRTGASNAGTSLTVCAGSGQDLFSAMPTLIKGHEYILLISHFTQTESGYKLSFKEGTAVITDTTKAALATALPGCDPAKVTVKLNKKIRCQSISANGSEFVVTPSTAQAISAVSTACSAAFDTDSITVTLDRALTPGDYTISLKAGADGNTMLDVCGEQAITTSTASFRISPPAPTLLENFVTPACAPKSLRLTFLKGIRCNSVAADGSDFLVTGPSAVSIVAATGDCVDGVTRFIDLQFASPIRLGGLYTVRTVVGGDGSVIIDECGQQTPVGSTLDFTLKDTVSAEFSYQQTEGCKNDTVQFLHSGNNQVNEWKWTFDLTSNSILRTPAKVYPTSGTKQVRLIVSNGFCSDTSVGTVTVKEKLRADFTFVDFVCPNDLAAFEDKSTSDAIAWSWNFGNGSASTSQRPSAVRYPAVNRDTKYNVSLIATNQLGCADTANKAITVVANCYIAVPSGFTPNGDGKNDFLFPANAYKAENLVFRVFNRFGQLVFETKDWTKRWDGRFNGAAQAAGTYVWTLTYTHRETRQVFSLKGATVLIR
jgi:gliding motility-associated-like protein